MNWTPKQTKSGHFNAFQAAGPWGPGNILGMWWHLARRAILRRSVEFHKIWGVVVQVGSKI